MFKSIFKGMLIITLLIFNNQRAMESNKLKLLATLNLDVERIKDFRIEVKTSDTDLLIIKYYIGKTSNNERSILRKKSKLDIFNIKNGQKIDKINIQQVLNALQNHKTYNSLEKTIKEKFEKYIGLLDIKNIKKQSITIDVKPFLVKYCLKKKEFEVFEQKPKYYPIAKSRWIPGTIRSNQYYSVLIQKESGLHALAYLKIIPRKSSQKSVEIGLGKHDFNSSTDYIDCGENHILVSLGMTELKHPTDKAILYNIKTGNPLRCEGKKFDFKKTFPNWYHRRVPSIFGKNDNFILILFCKHFPQFSGNIRREIILFDIKLCRIAGIYRFDNDYSSSYPSKNSYDYFTTYLSKSYGEEIIVKSGTKVYIFKNPLAKEEEDIDELERIDYLRNEDGSKAFLKNEFLINLWLTNKIKVDKSFLNN